MNFGKWINQWRGQEFILWGEGLTSEAPTLRRPRRRLEGEENEEFCQFSAKTCKSSEMAEDRTKSANNHHNKTLHMRFRLSLRAR